MKIKGSMSKKTAKRFPVSVVVPMRNAATTVERCIQSLQKQVYPIHEIIVVDNVSKDNSRTIVEGMAKSSRIPIRLLRQPSDRSLAGSYNRGVKAAHSPIVVFMTSDSALPTRNELTKLIQTLVHNPGAVAAYSTSFLPRFIWEKYNFWEKYYAARMVDNRSSLMILKFDCVRRDIFLKIGGFDEVNFGGEGSIGGEDAELTTRLNREGEILRSDAISLHLHYMAPDYSFRQVLKSRKMFARSYGRFLRKSAFLNIRTSILFLVRPILAILPFIPSFYVTGTVLLVLYAFLYTKEMFLAKSTLRDIKIVLIPFLNICLLYYELLWMIEAFFSGGKRIKAMSLKKDYNTPI